MLSDETASALDPETIGKVPRVMKALASSTQSLLIAREDDVSDQQKEVELDLELLRDGNEGDWSSVSPAVSDPLGKVALHAPPRLS